MHGKRGFTGLEIVVAAIPLLVLLGILLFNLYRSQLVVGATYNRFELQTQTSSCPSQAAFAKTFFDNDYGNNVGDKFPDLCDICRGGNDAFDADGDGMPDACDAEPCVQPARGTKTVDVCKSKLWDDKKKQCTLDCYGPGKGCSRDQPAACPI